MEEIRIAEELRSLLVKVIIPSIVAVSIKIAIASRKNQITVFNVVTSFVIGVGVAYLSSGLIISSFSDDWVPLMIALVTISGDKIGSWIIYKLNIDYLVDAWLDALVKSISRK